jgi:DNA-binding NarL/FixJ family response regulator
MGSGQNRRRIESPHGHSEERMKALLVDDHILFREGLALLMSNAFPELDCQQAGSISQALQVLGGDPEIRLVLLDLGLPDSAGVTSLRRLREGAPHTTVVVMSADETPETVLAAIDEGAAGFIPKTSRLGAMRGALETVLAGGVYLPPVMLGQRPETPPAVTSLGLSPRQLDVLRLLIDGKSNKLICRELELSESTVKTHLAAIFRKLEVSSRTQAVVAAARLGLRLGDAYAG